MKQVYRLYALHIINDTGAAKSYKLLKYRSGCLFVHPRSRLSIIHCVGVYYLSERGRNHHIFRLVWYNLKAHILKLLRDGNCDFFGIQWSQTVWACVASLMGTACVTSCKGQYKKIWIQFGCASLCYDKDNVKFTDARDEIFLCIWYIQCRFVPWRFKQPGYQQVWYWQQMVVQHMVLPKCEFGLFLLDKIQDMMRNVNTYLMIFKTIKTIQHVKSYEYSISCQQGDCDYIHYSDVIMSTMASQITSLMIVYSTVYSVTGEFPAQMASNAGLVSIWWRHHA